MMTKHRLMISLAILIGVFGCAAAQTAADPARTPKTQLTRAENRLKDWPALARYRDANGQLTPPSENEARVVFMGDSITDSWDDPKYGGFFPGKPYVDRGISGQTTPQMLVRFRPDVIALHPKGRRHPGGHKRPVRKYGADDAGSDSGQSGFDG
jgi:hypothetical protein